LMAAIPISVITI